MLTALAWTSIALAAMSSAILVGNVIDRPQRAPVMNVVWPITGLYASVFALWLYRVLNAAKSARWKGVLLSALHCASGCVIGDIIGAPIVYFGRLQIAGQSLYAEYVVQFTLAYIFGVVFQYFSIRSSRNVAVRQALIDAIKADTLSLTAFEVGMFSWAAIVQLGIFAADPINVTSPVYWLMMQIGLILGLATTYPANWLLVKYGIKAPMQTMPSRA